MFHINSLGKKVFNFTNSLFNKSVQAIIARHFFLLEVRDWYKKLKSIRAQHLSDTLQSSLFSF